MTHPLLNWREGEGWLVLSGNADARSDVRAQALALIKAGGGVAYLGLRVEDVDALMDDMNDLGAPTGYFVNILTEDDTSIYDRLTEAMCIVLPNIIPSEEFYSALTGAALRGITICYERGGVIFAEGASAMFLGRLFLDSRALPQPALNWVEDSFILPDVVSVSESAQARQLLAEGKARLALGIGRGSALALGKDGAILPLGNRQVTVVLGSMPAR